jgi:glycosyltransferase involved in cell wall biosynthesis
MERDLVSVIIPVYNGERHLDDAINSVLSQNYKPIEIIVVDDGSTDNSADIARTYSEVQYIYQTNQGPCTARNTGVAAAQGQFIAFLDADDIWLPNKLSIQVGYLSNHPEIGFVVAKRRMLIEKGIERPPWYRKHLFEEDCACFGPSAMVVRRDVLAKVGLWNPEFCGGDVGEWLSRAKDVGIIYTILPQTLVVIRVHDQNLTYNLDKVRSDILSALKASVDRKRKKNWMESDNNLEND